MPHSAISTVYQGLGCQHSLLPTHDDDFAPPSIPALTTKGFVHWQTIQTLLGPQTQVPVLRFAAANWSLKHPDTGTPLPVDLPNEAFPSEADADTDRWHRECARISRSKAAEAEPAEPSREAPKPEFTDRKVPYTHVRVNPTSPRDYFTSPRPVNVSYVQVPSPRPTPTGPSPRPTPGPSPERERARGREHLLRRQPTSTEDAAQRRRSFSDYPHSPQEARPVQVPHLVPERGPKRRRHSHPRHDSSSSDSDTAPISPRTTSRARPSKEPPPISVRRVYTGSSEDSPRGIRTTMGPPPIPSSHHHSPRPSVGGGRGPPSHDDGKRRSAFFDLKEKFTSFISPAPVGERAGSTSGSRGRRDGPGGSARGSREDILPSSRLSRSWSDIDTDDTDMENERRRRSRRPSHEPLREKERDRERDRERERERERERAARDRDRDRDRGRPARERDRAHSESDRDRERRDRERDTNPNPRERERERERLVPVPAPSPAASAATAALHRDTNTNGSSARRRGASDEDRSPRRFSSRGPYLAGPVVEGGAGAGSRRTSSHADLGRLERQRRDWEREERERERELRDRERDRVRDRERERERERFIRDDGGGGAGERWRREERLPRERERERDGPRERERDGLRERERMPSPALSGVTGVGGRKYPDIPWPRE